MTCRYAELAVAFAALIAVSGAVGAYPAHAGNAAPAATVGGVGLRLIDVPVDARNDPRAHLYIVDHLAPGSVIHRRIEISNTTASTRRVVLYPAAANVAKGEFLGAAGHTANDVSTWTSVRPAATNVVAGGRVIASVTITVPPDAAPGERYGVVWAEVRSAPTAGDSIVQVSRVCIRIYLSVGPGGPPAANFTIDSLTAKRAADGRPVVVATVHNTGGRALDMSGTLQLLEGPGGLRAGPFPATLGVTLAIGDREPVAIALDKRLPAGPWDALIALHSGLVERRARATITFPDRGASSAVKATVQSRSTRPRWLFPLVAGVAALVLVAVVVLGVTSSSRRRRYRSRAASGR